VTLVLVAHGTRDPAGAATADRLATALAERAPGVRVLLAYADVRRPSLADVLTDLDTPEPPDSADRVVVVPAFLASGYHVRVDLPEQIERSRRPGVLLAPPLGPARAVVTAAVDRLREAGRRPSDEVVLAAAGSSDPRALEDVRRAARLMSEQVGRQVRVGYVATGRPSVDEVVARTPGRVAVASWLLAPGLFHRWLARSGADVVSEPIGAHPLVVDQLLRRYQAGFPLPVSRSDNDVIESLPEVVGWDHQAVRRCASGGWPGS
jgi:sirohydrochlorin ferrochelatase